MIFEETYVSPCVLQGIIKQSEGKNLQLYSIWSLDSHFGLFFHATL